MVISTGNASQNGHWSMGVDCSMGGGKGKQDFGFAFSRTMAKTFHQAGWQCRDPLCIPLSHAASHHTLALWYWGASCKQCQKTSASCQAEEQTEKELCMHLLSQAWGFWWNVATRTSNARGGVIRLSIKHLQWAYAVMCTRTEWAEGCLSRG